MIRGLVRLALVGVALVVLYSALMVAAFAIPDGLVRRHIGTSVGQLELEGHPFAPFVGLPSLMPDNYTDALMLNQALNASDIPPLYAAFGNFMNVSFDASGEARPIESLRAAYEGPAEDPTAYATYWHGYQSWLRPLLVILDYRAIRYMAALVLLALAALAALALRARLGRKAVLALVVALIVSGAAIVPMSVQFASVYFLALLGVIGVARNADAEGRLRRGPEAFLVLGSLTAFLDLLTAPVLTLAWPLAVALAVRLRSPREGGPRRQLIEAAKLSAAWVAGYAGTWAAKWVIASAVLGDNVIADALSSAAYRMGGAEAGGVTPDRLGALLRNVAMLFPVFGFEQPVGLDWGVTAAVAAPALLAAVALLALAIRHPRPADDIARVAVLAVPALMPYAWYSVLVNHSWVHYWFTFRGQAATVFVAVFALLYAVDPRYLGRVSDRIGGLAGHGTGRAGTPLPK